MPAIPLIITAAIAVGAMTGCKREEVSQNDPEKQKQMEKAVLENMNSLAEYTENVTEMSEHVSNRKELVPVYARDGNGHIRVFEFTKENQEKALKFARQYGKSVKIAASGVQWLDFAYSMSEPETVNGMKFLFRVIKNPETLGNPDRDRQVREAFRN